MFIFSYILEFAKFLKININYNCKRNYNWRRK